ncbi:MAG: PSD1 domain-containing protein [Planctomycetaceae bacterium]|nr:PSD1 domain-containing protein [Planctomycetaceae bacterium]
MAIAMLVLSWLGANPTTQSRADDDFFEARIRPLFVNHCLPCHSDEQAEAGLSLESREGWISRDVISLGSPDQSLLIKVVRGEVTDLQMPPPDSDRKSLTKEQIHDLEQWIRDGAADPRARNTAPGGPARRSRQFQITEQDLAHWAFQALSHGDHQVHRKSDPLAAGRAIDEILNQVHAARGLQPLAKADPRVLVRRAYFDLWGLPPEPEVVERFAADPSDAAWSELIERLLASHHYGERWGRFWLDWVRFAESNGYERDGPKPHAWRYRDYVLESFSADKPYDRFLQEQLAGDLLIAAEGLTPTEHARSWREAIIATGYHRLHIWDDEPDNSLVSEYDDLDDVLVTTSAAIMGLTIGCARCHDHKFDPVSQADYYSLLDMFRDIDPYGLTIRGGGGRGTGRIETWLCADSELAQWRQEWQQQIDSLQSQMENAPSPLAEDLTTKLAALKSQKPPFEQALSIQARSGERPVTHVLARGDFNSPLQPVHAGLPEVFVKLGWNGPTLGTVVEQDTRRAINRLDFARWLTGEARALTARVLANRIWLNHFGKGIVETPDDFGYTGLPPTNLELLDFLAGELIVNDWSIKSLHRSIMYSVAYRRSSSLLSPESQVNIAIDEDNRLFWRQNLRRLDAESIRDSQLVYAGVLHEKRGGPSVFSDLPSEVRETANPISLSFWGTSPPEEQNSRSVFLFVKRSLKHPLLEAFDFANSHSPVGQRSVTTVSPQALVLLNDEFVRQQAERVFSRIASQCSERDARIQALWQLVWQRPPSEVELQMALQFLTTDEDSRDETQRWIVLTRAVLNSNETIYID